MAKKTGKRSGKGRSGKKRTAKRAGKKRTAKKTRSKARDYASPIGPGMSKKGQVPLRLLESRLLKLNAIVLKRGGRYLSPKVK